MRRVVLVIRFAFSALFAAVAAGCLFRGLKHLFGYGTPARAHEVASLAGVGPALGWFAAGIGCLLVAGEIYPKPPPHDSVERSPPSLPPGA